eukprot:9228548-Prorocentrum_lima.AAC.1
MRAPVLAAPSSAAPWQNASRADAIASGLAHLEPASLGGPSCVIHSGDAGPHSAATQAPPT